MAQREAIDEIARALLRNSKTPAIVALDDLIANIDRNLGNLLISGENLTLIDHGRSLTGPLWLASELDASAAYKNIIRDLLGTSAESLPFKSAVMNQYSDIVENFLPHISELGHLLDNLLEDEDAQSAIKFLADRSRATGIAHRIGVVA